MSKGDLSILLSEIKSRFYICALFKNEEHILSKLNSGDTSSYIENLEKDIQLYKNDENLTDHVEFLQDLLLRIKEFKPDISKEMDQESDDLEMQP